MAPTPSPPTSLPIIVLNHPFILLPHNRISVSLAQDQVEPLLELIQANGDTPLLVAAVPEMKNSGESATWGCAARLTRLARPAPGRRHYLATLLGVVRIRIDDISNETISLPHASVTYFPSGGPGATAKALDQFRTVATGLIDRQLRVPPNAQGDVLVTRSDWRRLKTLLDQEERVGFVADILMGIIHLEWQDRYDLLANGDVSSRLERAAILLSNQIAVSDVSKKITSAVDESLSKQQKEFFLRQQLSAIQKELSDLHRGSSAAGRRDPATGGGSELDDEDEGGEDYAELRKKIDALEKGSEVRAMGVREFKRLKRIPPNSAENGVIRSYLEWLTALPWPSASQPIKEQTLAVFRDPQFLTNARKQLDSDHYGLDKIKRRLIEHLAIVRIKELQRAVADRAASNAPSSSKNVKSSAIKAPILLFVGPPGVGKTSIAASLARTLQRPFNRISLGGVRDEAEIRGHRRTYVASGPGAIVQALRKAGRLDSVILLDEIDKVGHSSFHGDPSAALLEVLDPEQNHTFKDHYIDVPIDLSQTLFIATANTLDTIPAPLLDRCEVIHLSGYTFNEKLSIARRYLLPKQLEQNGLPADQLELTDGAMLQLATGYTRESGVRSLEREIGAVVRYKTVEWAEHQDTTAQAPYQKLVSEADLIKILGMPRWEKEEREREERRGIAWGLVVMGEGQGGVLPVETLTTPGSGKLMLTGSLGDVIRESGELALSWVKSHAYDLGITKSRYEDPLKMADRGAIDVHLHLPSGAQKKDGPSAGVAMVCAFVSLLSGFTIPTNLAMTGEITLRGRVTAVGGIKEKVLGAYRGGMTKLIIPYANRKDVEQDVAPEIRDAMEFVFVKSVEEALEAAFGIGTLGRSGMGPILVESRL